MTRTCRRPDAACPWRRTAACRATRARTRTGSRRRRPERISSVTPTPKSPRSSGIGNDARCTTARDRSAGLTAARRTMRPSHPCGTSRPTPCAARRHPEASGVSSSAVRYRRGSPGWIPFARSSRSMRASVAAAPPPIGPRYSAFVAGRVGEEALHLLPRRARALADDAGGGAVDQREVRRAGHRVLLPRRASTSRPRGRAPRGRAGRARSPRPRPW